MILFIKDCIFITSVLILTTTMGLPFLCLIPAERFKYRWLIAPVLGYGFIGFLATAAYVYGFSQHTLYLLLWGISAIILLILARKTVKTDRASLGCIRTYVWFFTLWFLALFIICLPFKLGGLQFASFQGWIWDQYAYVGQALAYYKHSYADLLKSDAFAYLQDPVQIFGAIELNRRPTVSILFRFLAEAQHQDMYRLGYLYLSVLISYAILAMTFLMTNLFRASLLRALILSIAVFIGFWGQAYIDFNAWAMTSSIPLLLVIMTYALVTVRAMAIHEPFKCLELLPLACLVGFSFYFYPENTVFQLAGFLVLFFLFTVVNIKEFKNNFLPSLKLGCALLLGLALSFVCPDQTIGFLLKIAQFASANVMTRAVYGEYLMPLFGQANWFGPLLDNAVEYSQQITHTENQHLVLSYIADYIFIQGHLGILYNALVDGFYGFLGMYFLTPLASIPPVFQDLWREILLVLAVFFFVTNIKSYVKAATRYPAFFTLVIIFVVMVLSFLFSANIFSLARAIYYIAPYCLILFFIPFIEATSVVSYTNILFIIMLLAQFGFGVARIVLVSSHHYPVYPLPYTFARAHYFPEGQSLYDWNVSRFDAEIKKCHRIYINVPNEWQEIAVTFYLYSKEKEFVKKFPVKTSVWATTPIGYQTFNGMEDCEFKTKENGLSDNKTFNELQLVPYRIKNGTQ